VAGRVATDPEEESVDPATRLSLTTRYRHGHKAVTAALERITEVELDARPAAPAWSPREVVHHLADSEMPSAIRLRRLVAEAHPRTAASDELSFPQHLH